MWHVEHKKRMIFVEGNFRTWKQEKFERWNSLKMKGNGCKFLILILQFIDKNAKHFNFNNINNKREWKWWVGIMFSHILSKVCFFVNSKIASWALTFQRSAALFSLSSQDLNIPFSDFSFNKRRFRSRIKAVIQVYFYIIICKKKKNINNLPCNIGFYPLTILKN